MDKKKDKKTFNNFIKIRIVLNIENTNFTVMKVEEMKNFYFIFLYFDSPPNCRQHSKWNEKKIEKKFMIRLDRYPIFMFQFFTLGCLPINEKFHSRNDKNWGGVEAAEGVKWTLVPDDDQVSEGEKRNFPKFSQCCRHHHHHKRGKKWKKWEVFLARD